MDVRSRFLDSPVALLLLVCGNSSLLGTLQVLQTMATDGGGATQFITPDLDSMALTTSPKLAAHVFTQQCVAATVHRAHEVDSSMA